jgi:hypothetical protein
VGNIRQTLLKPEQLDVEDFAQYFEPKYLMLAEPVEASLKMILKTKKDA